MTIATWLVAMVGPLLARLLVALGVTLVTITGATVAVTTLADQVKGSIGGLPSDALQLGGLLGCWQAIGIMLGAITFILTFKAASGFMSLAKT